MIFFIRWNYLFHLTAQVTCIEIKLSLWLKKGLHKIFERMYATFETFHRYTQRILLSIFAQCHNLLQNLCTFARLKSCWLHTKQQKLRISHILFRINKWTFQRCINWSILHVRISGLNWMYWRYTQFELFNKKLVSEMRHFVWQTFL